MRKKSLLLTVVAVLFACLSASATVTVTKKYLKLSDADFMLNKWTNGEGCENTMDAANNVLNLWGTSGNNGKFGSQAGWMFANPIDNTAYDKLVVKLKNEGPAVLQIKIGDATDQCASQDAAVSTTTQTYTFNLNALHKNNDAAQALITSFSTVYFWGYWGGGNKVDIDEIYFQKSVYDADATDYQEIDVTSGSTLKGTQTATNNNTSITFTEDWYGSDWGFDISNIDCKAYKYLVVVPRKEWEVGDWSSQFRFGLRDQAGTDYEGWVFANGYYQPRRATVFNLANKRIYKDYTEAEADAAQNTEGYDNMDVAKLGWFYIQAEHGTSATNTVNSVTKNYSATFDISAAFFTNDAHNYVNGDGKSGYNYKREATTAGTFGTVCLPYASAICGATAYEVVGVDNLTNPNKLYLKEVYGVLTAGTPYIYKTNRSNEAAADGCTEVEGNVTFYQAGTKTVAAPINNALIGSFTDNTSVAGDNSYILKDGKWCKGIANYVDQYKAYLTLTDNLVVPTASQAASYTVMDINSGIVTGIQTAATEKVADKTFYNMNGVRVDNPCKGLYIQNGKTIIVK